MPPSVAHLLSICQQPFKMLSKAAGPSMLRGKAQWIASSSRYWCPDVSWARACVLTALANCSAMPPVTAARLPSNVCSLMNV